MPFLGDIVDIFISMLIMQMLSESWLLLIKLSIQKLLQIHTTLTINITLQMSKDKSTIFTGKLKQYEITLKVYQGNKLYIRMENKESFDRWSKVIGRQFIESKGVFFKETFQSAKRLFDFLSQNFNKIVVSDGSLKINYGVIDKKSMDVSIDLVQEEIKDIERAQLKIGRLEEQLLEMKKSSSKKLLHINIWVSLCMVILFFSLLYLFKQNQDRNNQLEAGLQIADYLGHNPYNSHKKFYSITFTSASSAKVMKNESTGWQNFINKFPIQPQIGVMSYKIKVVKSMHSILFGFTTEKGLGVLDNFNSSEAVYYQNQKSKWLQSQLTNIIQFTDGVSQGEIIEVSVNFEIGKFQWRKEGNKLAECSIPQTMKGKAIYLSIIIYSALKEVQIYV